MASVKAKDTKPEMRVRSKLHKMGYRFRLHDKSMPSKPDIILRKYNTVIFVHGCFWHRHDCRRATWPKSNFEYWNNKFKRNVEKFKQSKKELTQNGWKVFVIWECQTEKEIDLEKWIVKNLKP